MTTVYKVAGNTCDFLHDERMEFIRNYASKLVSDLDPNEIQDLAIEQVIQGLDVLSMGEIIASAVMSYEDSTIKTFIPTNSILH